MSNHLFILGAGASYSSGAPLMNNFLDIARMRLAEGNSQINKKAFERALSAIGKLQLAHSKAQLDLVNLESVFNSFEMAKLISGFSDLTEVDIDDIIKSLKIMIVETLESSISYKGSRSGRVSVDGDYKKLISLIVDSLNNGIRHNYSFITFNYDILLDCALYNYGLEYNYYLNGQVIAGEIPLLKLHGSCNWAKGIDRDVIIPLSITEYFQNYSHKGLEDGLVKIAISKHMIEYFRNKNKEVSDEIVLIPPSWNKVSYGGGIKNVWIEAGRQLKQADHIHIIGYSFPDTDIYFNMLYSIGTISERPLTSIGIYNPERREEFKDKIRSLLGPGALRRLVFHEVDFENALPIISEKIKSVI
jgi:hypothetical protein